MKQPPKRPVRRRGKKLPPRPRPTIEEAIKAVQKAEAADRELSAKRQRRNDDMTAIYARHRRWNPEEAKRIEQWLRNCRKYAWTYRSEARTEEERWIVTRRIWDKFMPLHPCRGDSRLEVFSFDDLHSALWAEGYPSLQEQAPEVEPTVPQAREAQASEQTSVEPPPEGPETKATAPLSAAERGAARRLFVMPLLEKKGWSVGDWARESKGVRKPEGVDFHTANNYLKGVTKTYRSTRENLAKSLGVETDELPR
jgi:hypothetical protein